MVISKMETTTMLRKECCEIMEVAFYIILSLVFIIVICIAIDISRIEETMKSLKIDSRNYIYLMQQLVDVLEGKKGR